jgi:glycosyltransferase involved in cell wall biosynthesis
MISENIIINGRFLTQPVTGVQRYAREVISQFNRQDVTVGWLKPPDILRSAALNQLWIQSVMPFNISKDAVLWSPTNIGPVFCKKHVLTLHSIAEQVHPELYDKKYVAWRKWILPGLLKRVRKIITTSRYSRQTILDYYKQAQGKTEVIYNGVDLDLFCPRNCTEKRSIRQEYNLKKPFVLNVGTLSTLKNTNGLLKAWQLLPKTTRKELDLVIAGKPEKNIAYKFDKNRMRSVRFIGYVGGEELAALYSAAQLFVFPSLYESFGLPVLEAMACGTPVITSNNTALNEIAGPAVIVNPNSIDEIRDSIQHLVNSPKKLQKMSAEGNAWAARFTWKKTAEKTLGILRDYTK